MRPSVQNIIYCLTEIPPSLRPADLSLFSTSGCKRVAQKVDLVLEELEELEEVTQTEL